MIHITIYQNHANECTGFRCIGHSGYADAGSDIICAGVSALVINAINSIEKFTSVMPQLETEAESGLIDCRLKNYTDHDVALLMQSMILGLQGIQKDYGNEFIILDFKEV